MPMQTLVTFMDGAAMTVVVGLHNRFAPQPVKFVGIPIGNVFLKDWGGLQENLSELTVKRVQERLVLRVVGVTWGLLAFLGPRCAASVLGIGPITTVISRNRQTRYIT